MKVETSIKEARKKFLDMELAERLIRVEQTVSASFNQAVPYDKTAYYLSMSGEERKEFEEFLKNKKKKKAIFSLSIFACLFILALFNAGITGNVIGDVNQKYFSLPETIIWVIFGVLLVYGLYLIASSRRRKKLFQKHVSIIEDYALNKKVLK